MNAWTKKMVGVAIALLLGTLVLTAQEKSEKKEQPKRVSVTKAKLLKRVDPGYPPKAIEAKIEGMVVLEAVTNEEGHVIDVRVVKSAHPLLDEAAMVALKQWVYAPYMLNDKPKSVAFTVTMNFQLSKEDKEKKAPTQPGNASANCAKLVKRVDPVYPQAALDKKIGGVVLLELQVDEKGAVQDARVVKSDHELLNEAALVAARQWAYMPCLGPDGKPQPFNCTITIMFVLPK